MFGCWIMLDVETMENVFGKGIEQCTVLTTVDLKGMNAITEFKLDQKRLQSECCSRDHKSFAVAMAARDF